MYAKKISGNSRMDGGKYCHFLEALGLRLLLIASAREKKRVARSEEKRLSPGTLLGMELVRYFGGIRGISTRDPP